MKKSNLFKQILAYTLVLSVIFSQMVFSFGASATEVNSVWDGTKAENFAGGDGSAASPFLIDTAEQLYKMVEEYHTYEASYGKYFRITNDLYLNNVADGNSIVDLWGKKNWLAGYGDTIATASEANSFNGTLDGAGHTIYGLYVQGVENAGLFPAISSYAVVKNLNFNNLLISGGSGYGGAIAGQAIYYAWQSAAQISNCSVVNATIGQWENISMVGGFLGNINECSVTFTNCYSYDLSLSNFDYKGVPGGIVGSAYSSSGTLKIINSYSSGNFPVNSLVNKAVCTNVYTDTAIPEGNTTAGVTVLTSEQMKGENAKTNMTGFDFKYTWETVENAYPVLVANPISVWDGTKDYSLEGTGSNADPYLIKTAAQLAAIVTGNNSGAFTGKYFKLANDIRINDTSFANWKESARNWVWANFRFIGTFDGNGHTIDGLYYKGSQRVMGLFSYVGADDSGTYKTTVKNFNMTNAYIESTATDGAGFASGQASRVAYFDSIYIGETCEIKSTTVSGAGGILGQSGYNVFMSNIAMNGKVVGGSNVGAFVGKLSSGARVELKSSYTSADLYAQGVTDRNLAAASRSVYVAKKQGTVDAVATELTIVQMKGVAAKTNMPGLNFKYMWETVDGSYPVFKSDPVYVWDGSVATSYDGFRGSGTAEDPYLIENGAQLAYAIVQSSSNGYYFKLVKDILLNDTSYEGWQSSARSWIQNTSYRFNGELDGDGHIIEGLYFNKSSAGRYGLIAYIGKLASGNDHVATVKNIKFVGASITNTAAASDATQGAAVVAGQASGETIFENIIIDETSSVIAPNIKGVAGIVGRGYNNNTNAHVTIRNCAVLGTINGGTHTGAFCGTFWDPNLVITINNSFADTTYGLIGGNSGAVAITNTYTNVLGDKDTGAVQVDSDKMIGAAAEENMPGLDFACIWETVEGGYPVLRKDPLYGWDGTKAENFAGGTGTKNDPFLIENGGQLYKMVADYSNADITVKPETQTYFKITKDINLGGKQWYTITVKNWLDNAAYSTIGFNGIIYGEGHTIFGLNNKTAAGAVGLIPVATQGAQIYDLHLEYGNLPRVNYQTYAVGALIGLARSGENSSPIIIEGCSVKDFTIASCNGSAAFVGYLYSQSITIKNSYCLDTALSHTAESSANSGAFIGITNGNDWGNSIVIENSFCNDVKSTILHMENMASITTFNNVYTQDSDYANTVTGLTKLTSAQMQGSAAIDNLVGFNFNQVWSVGEAGEYPTLKSCDEKALYWNGTAADSFAGGSGTANNPYLISNAEQLYLLATLGTDETYGKYYQLTNDINISRVYTDWEEQNPYKWTKKTAYLDGFAYSNSFAGILDGAGYTVSGLFIEDTVTNGGTYAYGLMPLVSAGAVIKNITVDNVYADITGNAYAGAVAGAAHVTGDDISNPLNMVQFVGVDADNCDITATQSGDILGLATRGVKFELCNAETLYGSGNTKISVRNCNSAQSYSSNVRIYNRFNTDASALTSIVGNLICSNNLYITDINGDSNFDIRDLVSAKKALTWRAPEESLVWSQEFGGNAMDYSVWTKNTSMSRGSTLVYNDNTTVSGGTMTMSCADTGNTDTNGDKIYSVNYGLDTLNTMSFKYGRLEMRAKVPFSAGAFPSLWLTSRNAIGYDKYSEYSSEIDIFEIFAKSGNEERLLACVHKWYNDENGVKTGDECSSGTNDGYNKFWQYPPYRGQTFSSSEQAEWHTFVFEWDENLMTFKVDGTTYYTVSRSVFVNTVFDKDGYDTKIDGLFEQALAIRLNNHMYTPGEGSAYSYTGSDTINPSNLSYEVDYIRLYQKNDGNSTINFK